MDEPVAKRTRRRISMEDIDISLNQNASKPLRSLETVDDDVLLLIISNCDSFRELARASKRFYSLFNGNMKHLCIAKGHTFPSEIMKMYMMKKGHKQFSLLEIFEKDPIGENITTIFPSHANQKLMTLEMPSGKKDNVIVPYLGHEGFLDDFTVESPANMRASTGVDMMVDVRWKAPWLLPEFRPTIEIKTRILRVADEMYGVILRAMRVTDRRVRHQGEKIIGCEETDVQSSYRIDRVARNKHSSRQPNCYYNLHKLKLHVGKEVEIIYTPEVRDKLVPKATRRVISTFTLPARPASFSVKGPECSKIDTSDCLGPCFDFESSGDTLDMVEEEWTFTYDTERAKKDEYQMGSHYFQNTSFFVINTHCQRWITQLETSARMIPPSDEEVTRRLQEGPLEWGSDEESDDEPVTDEGEENDTSEEEVSESEFVEDEKVKGEEEEEEEDEENENEDKEEDGEEKEEEKDGMENEADESDHEPYTGIDDEDDESLWKEFVSSLRE